DRFIPGGDHVGKVQAAPKVHHYDRRRPALGDSTYLSGLKVGRHCCPVKCYVLNKIHISEAIWPKHGYTCISAHGIDGDLALDTLGSDLVETRCVNHECAHPKRQALLNNV